MPTIAPSRVARKAAQARAIADQILTTQQPCTPATWRAYGIARHPRMVRLVLDWIFLRTTTTPAMITPNRSETHDA